MHEGNKQDVLYESIIDRIDISDYLRTFLHDLSELEGRPVEVTNELDARRIQGLMDNPHNTRFKSLADITSGQPYWDEQEVTYIPSNLGKRRGFLFYFICYSCERRTKYLYFHSYLEPPSCRKCQRLPYKRPSWRKRHPGQGPMFG